jgi:uncharacterized protein
MTLIDSRPGIGAVLEALAAESGAFIDVPLVLTRLGPPLNTELANWFAPDLVSAMADRFREFYPSLAIEPTPALAGASEALASVRAVGGRSLVVTAKFAPNAELHLSHLGLEVDALEGWRWAEGKVSALHEHGARIYVGDHPADMAAAGQARVHAVGVTTGAATAAELVDAGADVVLDSLLEFPAWLDQHLLTIRLAALEQEFAELDSVVVAFSGGADSAFVLAAAVRALGPMHVVAATVVSEALAPGELELARDIAHDLGVRHLAPRSYETSQPRVIGELVGNPDSCYFCKAELLEVLRPVADRLAVRNIVTGIQADDAALASLGSIIRTADDDGALAPLREAGLTKAQIREASRQWDLVTWDKPATVCVVHDAVVDLVDAAPDN